MADKAITDLTQATQITNEDLFVLEQSGEAKKLKGSQVVQYAKDAVAAEVQGVKEYANNAKTSADAAAASAEKAASAAEGIDDKVAAADASAKAAAASAAAAASSATGVDEKVQAAQTAATNAAKSETAAKNAQTAAANAQKAAETAQTGAQSAKTAAESAQEAAESAKNAAADSSTAAGQKATQAAQSAEDAASAKSAAETAKTDAQAARDAIVNMIVEAVTLETGKPATVSKSLVDNVYKLVFGLPRGDTGAPGPKGAPGNGISGIALKSGTHAPGTSDVYTITLTDGTTFDFAVYNGANGAGAGDMLASVYDPQGKHQDIFKYVDDAIGGIPTPDVSAQIKAHNESETAHPDIRNAIPTKTSQLDNDSGFLTQHQDISGKLDKTGDGSNVTAAFTAASTRINIATGEKLSVLLGKIAKWLGDLKALAFKDKVAKTDLVEDVQQSLDKADSALQSAPVTSVNGKTGDVEINVDSGVFWATKDVTTYAEIVAAANAGKMVLFKYNDTIYQLTCIWSSQLFFTTLNSGLTSSDSSGVPIGISSPRYVVNSANNTWTYQSGNIATGDMTKTLTRKITLTSSAWDTSTKQYTVTCANILANPTLQEISPIPVDTSYNSAWKTCGVECVAQAANKLTFQCATIPTVDIEVYILIRYLNYLG